MTSHDVIIQTMSHLYAFLKKRAKLLLFSDIRKFFNKNLRFYSIYCFIWKGNDPINSPSTKKSALYHPTWSISSTNQ